MSETVLIIDDSISMQRLIRFHLGEEYANVFSADNGVLGLEMAATLAPDLIVLDLDLPDMNGFDVCRFLKADPSTAAIPVVFLAASDSVDVKVCGLDLQASDFITKPFEPGEFSARLRAALRSRRSPSAGRLKEGAALAGGGVDFWEHR